MQQRVDKLRKKPAIFFIRRIVAVKSIARMLRFDRQPVGRIQKSCVASGATFVKVAVYTCKKPCREPAAHDAAVMPSTVGVNALDLYPCQKRNRSPVLAVRSRAFHGKGRAGAIGQNRKINNSYINGMSPLPHTSPIQCEKCDLGWRRHPRKPQTFLVELYCMSAALLNCISPGVLKMFA